MVLELDQLLFIREAMPLPGNAHFEWETVEPPGYLDFMDREIGFFSPGLWDSLADKLDFDQQLFKGYTLVPVNPQMPPISQQPALRGTWTNGRDEEDVRTAIALARIDPTSGRPGWYSSFGFFAQAADGTVYAPGSTTEVVGVGSWLHAY